jgi:hypothetical protein
MNAAALPLLAGGPPGWVLFGVVTVVTLGAGALLIADSIDNASDDADQTASDSTTDASCATCKKCPECSPPAGTEELERIDRVPPSRPHYPCPGDHAHYRVMRQNPRTCACFWNKGRVECL